ncbi:MAG: DUF1653 domain-containing protein [Lachnospiraceae bacterium]
MRDLPRPNEIYRHFKGNCYRIMTLATETETRQTLVVYQALYGDYQMYARELSMFMSPVDKEKYPDVKQQWRFELVTFEASQQSPIPYVEQTQQGTTSQADQAKEQATPVADQVKEQTISAAEQKQESSAQESLQVDPMVMKYLDADTYEDKLQILVAMRERLTDEMINTMSIAVDVEIPPGDINDRYEQLKYCLVTRERFECNRLR